MTSEVSSYFLSSEGLIGLILHIDKHLESIINNYQHLTYLFLFLIVFAETGLIVTPFLPGDSLLFAAGSLAASLGVLNPYYLFIVICSAAILGDFANYYIGKRFGNTLFEKNYKIIKKQYLIQTEEFYQKHGVKTIILARFVPIVRTFAPFVAGMAKMNYSQFLMYNIIGGVVWSGSLIFLGYFFGNIPLVKNNFSMVVIVIILVSVLPIIFEFIKHRLRKD